MKGKLHMSAIFTYDDLWSFYRQQDRSTQKDILQQLNLDEVFRTGTMRERKEILSEAPDEIVAKYRVQMKTVKQLEQELFGIIRR